MSNPSETQTSSPSPAPFAIGAEGINAEQIVNEIKATVAAKMKAGLYADARIARAERSNLRTLSQDESLFELYLECLREAVWVDINDFDIRERRRGLAPLLVAFKRGLWKLLRFYTYRLWSQQNQVNGLLLSATEELDRKYRDRLRLIETRMAELESRLPHP